MPPATRRGGTRPRRGHGGPPTMRGSVPRASTVKEHDARFDCKLPASEKERWRRAAAANGDTLTGWVLRVCGEQADRLFPRTHRLPPKRVDPNRCVRWMYHVEGVYCPGCDTVIP